MNRAVVEKQVDGARTREEAHAALAVLRDYHEESGFDEDLALRAERLAMMAGGEMGFEPSSDLSAGISAGVIDLHGTHNQKSHGRRGSSLAASDRFPSGLKEKENAIRNLSHEEGYIVDGNGSVLAHVRGNDHSVEWTPKQAENMKGKTVTHNHPGSGRGEGFSDMDFTVFAAFRPKEFRAVTDVYDYSLRFPDDDVEGWLEWRKANHSGWYYLTLADEWREQLKALNETGEVWDIVSQYGSELGVAEATHRMAQRIAEKYNLVYERTEADA